MNLEQLEREWVNPQMCSGPVQARMWDQRAEEYMERPIPRPGENLFLQYLLEKAKPDKSMNALDIGCGAGLYTIALAEYVEKAFGVDVSPDMIRGARKRAEGLGTANTEFFIQDWANADPDALNLRANFDVVFAHMTPAVCDYLTLDKMNACARGHCFLVKPARRHDKVQDAAFSMVGITGHRKQMDDMTPNAFAYLWLKGYNPEVSYREEIWEMEKPLKNMTDWCIDRAGLQKSLSHGEEDRIRKYLRDISMDGKIKETVTTTIVTVYWHV